MPRLRPLALALAATSGLVPIVALAAPGLAAPGGLTPPRVRLRAPLAHRAEGERLRAWAEASFERMDALFAAQGGAHLVGGVTLDLVVHAEPNAKARAGLVLLETGTTEAGRFARLNFLAPSRHPLAARTAVGEPMDAAYFQRILVHEIGTLYLAGLTGRKPAGWRLHDAPSWFVQGLEEWVALRHSTPRAWLRTRKRYQESLRRRLAAGEVSVHQGLKPYRDGAMAVDWLVRTQGWETVLRLLGAPQESFAEAVEATLGEPPEAWLRRTLEGLGTPPG